MVKQRATDFEKIINDGRERKKNEDLAARIFSKDSQRRTSAPIKAGPGASLASRVGVKKRLSSSARIPAGNVNGDWTHDLHNQSARGSAKVQKQQSQHPAPNSLAARIHAPGTKPPKQQPTTRPTRQSKLQNALSRSASSPALAQQQVNVVQKPKQTQGIQIRGLAGPYVVLAQNFARGTTAADIESAMTPVGGLITSCRLVKTHPIVIAEIIFESKDGADAVIAQFNGQNADGKDLHVYMKPAGTHQPSAVSTSVGHLNERNTGNGVLVDGSMGFDEPMTNSHPNGTQHSHSKRNLYSDDLFPDHASGRRGRGNRGGRNGR